MAKRLVARWESRGGAYFFEIYHDKWGYTYSASGAGGVLGNFEHDADAIAYAEQPTPWGRWLDKSQPAANKTPMKRVL